MAFNAMKKCSLGLKEMQIKTPLLSPSWLLGISNIRNSPKRLLMRTWRSKLSFIAGGRCMGTAPEEGIWHKWHTLSPSSLQTLAPGKTVYGHCYTRQHSWRSNRWAGGNPSHPSVGTNQITSSMPKQWNSVQLQKWMRKLFISRHGTNLKVNSEWKPAMYGTPGIVCFLLGWDKGNKECFFSAGISLEGHIRKWQQRWPPRRGLGGWAGR